MTIKITCVVNDVCRKDMDLKSEHGLSFWIEVVHGNVLFDTGQSAAVLSHNLKSLGLRPENVDMLALSHAHYDHTGGLEEILSKNNRFTLFVHPDIFTPRYSYRNGEYHSIGMALTRKAISSKVDMNLCDIPCEIMPGFWTTGEIIERPEPMGSSAYHFVRTEKGWQPDPYRDDMSLVIKTDLGLVVVCGCCHAGMLNTLFHVKHNFQGPIVAVIGGVHLVSADDQQLAHVIEVLQTHFENLTFYLNHCTGDKAFEQLAKAFGDRVKAFPAGATIEFPRRI